MAIDSTATVPTGNSKPASKAGLGIFLVVLAASLAMVGYAFILPTYRTNQILKHGVPAEGIIKTIEPTGNYYTSQPEARIMVEVHPTSVSGEPPPFFLTEVRKVINPIYAPQFQPGKRVWLRYLPEDHSKAAIEYIQGS